LFLEVESEVRALHEFTQNRVNDSLNTLTYLSITGVIIALCALFFQTDGICWYNALSACFVGLGLTILSLLYGRKLVACLQRIYESKGNSGLNLHSTMNSHEDSPFEKGIEPGDFHAPSPQAEKSTSQEKK
jgi:hypothetical protein